MPLYEYHCRNCDRSFEMLRRMTDDDTDVRCPHCGSDQVERELSAFASFAPDGSGASSGSGPSCSSGRFG
jgi:putative FmdB family regulatory protein